MRPLLIGVVNFLPPRFVTSPAMMRRFNCSMLLSSAIRTG
jgi:hypothetical protein